MSELKEYEVRIGRKLYQTLPPIVYVVADDNQPKLLNDKVYLKSEADKMIAEKDKEIALLKERICNGDVSRLTWIDDCIAKDKEIAELKAKLEDVQATAYAESVDAGMRERRLRRALYNSCANWAKCEERINNRDAYEASEYLPSAEDKFRRKAERWSEMERKCRAKAEEYK